MLYTWLILLSIAVIGAFIAEKIKQPYPTVLVVLGLLIGLAPIDSLTEFKKLKSIFNKLEKSKVT